MNTKDLSVFTEEELATLRIFIQTDQSGAEALIVAYLCEAGRYRQLFQNKIKPHSYIGMHLFSHIWPSKMREHNLITGDSDFDIGVLMKTPIPELKNNKWWSVLAKLIKDSDDWSLKERYYYLAKQTEHCVDSKTEVLTRIGWQSVQDIACYGEIKDEIAVYAANGDISFEIPSVWNSYHITDTMYSFIGDEVNQLVTANHKMIYYDNQKLLAKPAKALQLHNRINIPTSGLYIGGNIHEPDWKIKLLVAIQADGHWCMSEAESATHHLPKVIFRLIRNRKIDRLRDILKESGLRFTDEQHANCVTCITVFDLEDVVKYFNNTKVWGSWLLNFSTSNLRLLIDELKYWDGTIEQSDGHKREEYSSAIETNIDWLKTICHLVEKQGTQSISREQFRLGINNRKYSIARYKSVCKDWTGTVYCPTVSTGMFLVRRKGKISVTGNSTNYDVHAPTFRMNILEKSGGKVVISHDEAVRFIDVKHTLYPEIRGSFHRWVQRQAEQHKMLYNLHGHPYTITSYEFLDSNWKELFAWIPQSTVGEITNIAYTRMFQYISEHKKPWDLLANTHDSYLLQCPLAEEKECGAKAREFMEQSFVSPIDGAPFTMGSETQSGFNWGVCKKGNDLGLRELKV